MSQQEHDVETCTHPQLVVVGPDLYQCQQCGVVIEIIQARILTEEYGLSVMASLFPEFRALLEGGAEGDSSGSGVEE